MCWAIWPPQLFSICVDMETNKSVMERWLCEWVSVCVRACVCHYTVKIGYFWKFALPFNRISSKLDRISYEINETWPKMRKTKIVFFLSQLRGNKIYHTAHEIEMTDLSVFFCLKFIHIQCPCLIEQFKNCELKSVCQLFISFVYSDVIARGNSSTQYMS